VLQVLNTVWKLFEIKPSHYRHYIIRIYIYLYRIYWALVYVYCVLSALVFIFLSHLFVGIDFDDS